MNRLDFVFFDAGGGHRSAATALTLVIEREQRPWDVRLVNLQEALDELDITRRLTGVRMEDYYNRMLKSGFTLGAEQAIPLMQALIRWWHRAEVRLLAKFWKQDTPDVVVSVVPHFNRVLRDALKLARPKSELVTVITDFADFPPHFWLERQEQYVVCGTEKAVEQAYGHGFPPEKVFQASGMIIQPKFYDPVDKDRRAERLRLGLDPDKPTGLVLFGGQGSRVMRDIVDQLDESALDLQLILICGHNQALARHLAARKTRIAKAVEGFTREIPYFMHLSDFFMGKPGPGSISEALAMHLPVIVERNAFTLPQERYNTEWVQEKGVGLVVRNFRKEVGSAVSRMLEPEAFARYRANAAAIHNRAVFEIPEFLEKVLSSCGRE